MSHTQALLSSTLAAEYQYLARLFSGSALVESLKSVCVINVSNAARTQKMLEEKPHLQLLVLALAAAIFDARSALSSKAEDHLLVRQPGWKSV